MVEALLPVGVRIVVTSQERLRVDGERVLALPPLTESAGVRLFVDAGRGVAVTEAEAGDVAEIVRGLDALPLAIELAATQVAGLGVALLRERLDDRLDLLTRGRRTGAPRHRTLRAVVEWSFGLLEPLDRLVLCRLAAFAGGFSVSLAESVVADERGAPAADRGGAGRAGRPVPGGAARAAPVPAAGDRAGVGGGAAGGFAGRRRDLSAARCRDGRRGGTARPGDARTGSGAGGTRDRRPAARSAPGPAVRDPDVLVRLAAAMYRYGYHCQQYEVLAWGYDAAGCPGTPGWPAALASAATHAWGRGDLAAARELGGAGGAAAPDEAAVGTQGGHEVLGDVALVGCDGRPPCITTGRWRSPDSRIPRDQSVWAGRRGIDAGLDGPVRRRRSGRPSRRWRWLPRRATPAPWSSPGTPWARCSATSTRPVPSCCSTEAAEMAAAVDDRLFRGAAETAAAAIGSRHGDPVPALADFRDVLALWRRAGNDTCRPTPCATWSSCSPGSAPTRRPRWSTRRCRRPRCTRPRQAR